MTHVLVKSAPQGHLPYDQHMNKLFELWVITTNMDETLRRVLGIRMLSIEQPVIIC